MERLKHITAVLTQELKPIHLEVLNESHMHSGPSSETHFRVVVVSSFFENRTKVERQRLVYGWLNKEFSTGLHALALRTLTPEEWQKEGGVDKTESPACHGGGRNSR